MNKKIFYRGNISLKETNQPFLVTLNPNGEMNSVIFDSDLKPNQIEALFSKITKVFKIFIDTSINPTIVNGNSEFAVSSHGLRYTVKFNNGNLNVIPTTHTQEAFHELASCISKCIKIFEIK